MSRTAIAQIAKLIGRELESGTGPSGEALATGPILADAGATAEIVDRLFAEARRKRPNRRHAGKLRQIFLSSEHTEVPGRHRCTGSYRH